MQSSRPYRHLKFGLLLMLSLLFLSAATISHGQCNGLTLPDTVSVCAYGTVSVTATVTDTASVRHVIWTPGTGVSDTNSLRPTITMGATSAMYYLSVSSISTTELVTNGAFTAGNTGFSSSYRYVTTGGGPGDYAVGTNPRTYNSGWPSMGDHTTGSGPFMIVDGSLTAGRSIWCQTITVIPNTFYDFSAWATLFYFPSPSLNFTINSTAIGSTFTLSSIGTWAQFTYTWYSGSATSATICVSDAATAYVGNDFGLDDFSFRAHCTDSDSVYVKVINPVPVHLGADVSVCNGGSVTFSSSDTYTSPSYLWSTGAGTASITASASGTYWLRVGESGCYGFDTVVLTVNPYPRVNLGPDTAICQGSSYTMNPAPAAGETFLWSTGATIGSLTVSTPGTYWLRVDSNGCLSRDTIVISSKPVPVVGLGPDTSLCSGTAITLSSSVGYTAPTYLWSNGATTPTISPTTTNNYWLRVTDRGCIGVDTIAVTFRAHPRVNLGPDTSFCQGGSFTLTLPAGADSYLWNTGATTNSITVTTTGVYWAFVDSVGCTSTDTVRVIEVPAFGVHLGPDTTFCTLVSVLLQSSDVYTTSPTYLWNTGATTPSISVTATGTYWLQVNQLGCVVRDTVNIVIKYDSLHIINNDTAICLGKSVQAIATTLEIGGTYTYQWIPTAGIATSTVINALITPDTSATYVLVASTPGCPPLMDSFHIDVQPYPAVFIGGNRFKCQYDTLHVDAIVQPSWYRFYSYAWTPAADLDYSTTSTVVFSGQTTTKLYVTVSTPAGCSGQDSAVIILVPGDFGSVTPEQQLCPHDSVQLIASGGSAYHWYPPLYLNDSLAAVVWVRPVASQKYSIIVTGAHGCTDTVTTGVHVFPAALISLDDSVKLYPGETVHLSPLTNCSTFMWFPPAGLSSTVISDPVASPEIDTKYMVSGTTTDGCTATDSVTVLISQESILVLPNAFTPGNGPNSTLRILRRGIATLSHFRIFNRWGNLVYETKNIDEGWDGQFNGAPQPFGVYVYEVQAITSSGRLVNLHGNVTLLR